MRRILSKTTSSEKRWRGLSTRVRLALGMSLFAGTIVFGGQLLGLMPNENKSQMQARKLQTETLAIIGSSVAETPAGLKAYHKTLQNTIKRNRQIRSIGLRNTRTDRLQFDSGTHQNIWSTPDDNRSNDEFMFVPIFVGDRQIAQLEVCYKPLLTTSSFLKSHTVRLALFVLGISFFFFYWMLSRTLKQLDPRGAVPKRVREAFNTMEEGLLILNRSGQIMMANDKFSSLVGFDSDDLIGRNIDQFSWSLPNQELPWETVLRNQQSISQVVLKIVDTRAIERTFYVSAAPVLGQQKKTRGVIVTFDDITVLEQQKTELVEARLAADEANDAKSQFLSRMTHELRTPMNAIIGYTDILRQGDVNADEQVRHLSIIQTSSEHLLMLINDILDLSKVEAGQLTVEQRATPVVSVLQNVIDTLVVKANEKNLDLRAEIHERIPHTIQTDETRLRQVLINIVGNAIKFTSNGGVRLIVRLINTEQRPMLQFDVADTGIGMSAEALENIFDPFTQADCSITRKFGGTGLGLAISKQLTEALGGHISVKSEQGVGTIFQIVLDPGAIPSNAQWIDNEFLQQQHAPIAAVAQQPLAQKFVGGHVLIVDDSKANRDLASLLLRRAGLTCDQAEDGVEAIEKISFHNYDAVLMDVQMPRMDGLTATGHIRSANLSQLPIIALTALASEEEKARCLAAGYSEFLTKPIRMVSVFDVLGKFIEVTIAEDAVYNVEAPKLSNRDTPDLQNATPVASFVNLTRFHVPDVVRSTLPSDEEFREIVVDFVSTLPAKLSAMETALADNDFEELKRMGHWLAGCSGTVGLQEFVEPARAIEQNQGTNPDQVAALIDLCRELGNRVCVDSLAPV